MSTTKVFSLTLLLIVIFMLSILGVNAQGNLGNLTWNIETVDKGNVGPIAGIVVDSNNSSHIAYSVYNASFGTSNLLYASLNPSGWNIETVAKGSAISLALDRYGNPHILFSDSESNFIEYAERTGSNWTTKATGIQVLGASLAIDLGGNPRITYIGNNEQLNYAVWAGSSWNIQTIAMMTAGLPYFSFVLDSNDNPHIMYEQGTTVNSMSIEYAYWNASHGWVYQTVLENATIAQLVLDRNNYPHFTYTQDGSASMRTIGYASWNGSNWNTQPIASNIKLISNGGYLALDQNNFPSVDYFIPGSDNYGDLIFAKWTGNSWDAQIVDSNASRCGPVIIGPNGTQQICYLGQVTLSYPGASLLAYLMFATTQSQVPAVTSLTNSNLSSTEIGLIISIIVLIIIASIITLYLRKR